MSAAAALAVILLVVAWLTAAGMAVRSVSRIWLRHWVERGLRGASTAELYLERPQRLLVAAGTGVALAVFAAGELLGAASARAGLVLVERLVGAAVVILILGQLVPRAIARRWATRLLPVLLPPLRLFDALLAPVRLLARGVVRLARPERPPEGEASPREGIEDLLREGELEGVGEHDEIAIISGVVQFGEKTLGNVVTPRPEVFALDETLPPPELARRIAQSAYSRVPIFRGTIDTVIGMVHVFDVLKAGAGTLPPIRPVAYAKASKPCNEQLFEMLRARRHLAVVQDDAGHTLGIVTLEDLLEELVGDIRDEHDEPLPPRPADAA
jgi:putative hemolysin